MNPDKARFPDFDIYLDEISEMYYVKTVVLDFDEKQEESLATVAPKIADALDEFFTEHQTQAKRNHCSGGCFSTLHFMIRTAAALRGMEVTDLVWQMEQLNGVTMYYHIGITFGYSAFWGYIPAQKIGFAILSNALGFDIGGLGKSWFRPLALRAKATDRADFLPNKYLGVYEASNEPDLLKACLPSPKLVVS